MAKLALAFVAVSIGTIWAHDAHMDHLDVENHVNYGMCPYEDGWHSTEFICYRETHDRVDFWNSVRACLADDIENGPYVSIMPVGKLRNFINRYTRDEELAEDYDEVKHHHGKHGGFFHDDYGPFRVNAMKGEDHMWREYPSGDLVPFHHFPDFDPHWGSEGDTLIWHPSSDELRVVDKRKEYTALCYRPQYECRRCMGWLRGDHECNDAGYCIDGVCHCDEYFSGTYCQAAPPSHHYVLLTLGGDHYDMAERGNGSVQIYDFQTDTSCFGPNLPTSLYGPIGGYTNGQALICGGQDTWESSYLFNKNCWSFDHRDQVWYPAQNMERNIQFGDTVNLHNGHSLWAVGGSTVGDSEGDRTFVFSKEGHWEQGPDLPRPRYGCCVAQISECEFAVMGGTPDRGLRDPDDVIRVIDIYNVLTDTWRCADVQLPYGEAAEYVDCATIEDYETGHPLVVIGGTEDYDIRTDDADIIVWDTVAETITRVPDPRDEFDNEGMHVVQFSRYDALLIAGDETWRSRIYRFNSLSNNDTLVNQNFTGRLNKNADFGVSMMVPKGYMHCIEDDPTLPIIQHPEE